jgi:hypothetical protein
MDMTADAHAIHPVGAMAFGGDGPASLEISASFSSVGRTAGQWLVDVTAWEHEELVDHDNPVQCDMDRDEQLPEASWAMSPQKALRLAALLTEAAETAALFGDMPSGS